MKKIYQICTVYFLVNSNKFLNLKKIIGKTSKKAILKPLNLPPEICKKDDENPFRQLIIATQNMTKDIENFARALFKQFSMEIRRFL